LQSRSTIYGFEFRMLLGKAAHWPIRSRARGETAAALLVNDILRLRRTAEDSYVIASGVRACAALVTQAAARSRLLAPLPGTRAWHAMPHFISMCAHSCGDGLRVTRSRRVRNFERGMNTVAQKKPMQPIVPILPGRRPRMTLCVQDRPWQ
jgi:hypothetical protein